MSREETPAYIARCKTCGAIIMATVDKPEYAENVADDVADCIRRGFAIERVTVGYVHKNGGLDECKCTQADNACTQTGGTVAPVESIIKAGCAAANRAVTNMNVSG